jgi:hypothetical protein
MTKRDGIMVVENSSFDPALQGSYKTNFNLNYLTIPVLASILVKRNWQLHFGPIQAFIKRK